MTSYAARIGSLLIASGSATEQRINEAKKYAKRGRFEPGYILDSFAEERAQEMTIDTTRAEMVYKGAIYEFIDVPGHLELIKIKMDSAGFSIFSLEKKFEPATSCMPCKRATVAPGAQKTSYRRDKYYVASPEDYRAYLCLEFRTF